MSRRRRLALWLLDRAEWACLRVPFSPARLLRRIIDRRTALLLAAIRDGH